MNKTSSTDSSATPARILDAAEQLFIELGYAATSLRAIANQAGVNLAATNYHFGSKEGLLAAVVHRHIHPVNEERLLRLNRLLVSQRPLTLREILEAFFYPLAETLPNEHLPAVMGRVLSEPESLTRPIIAEEFTEVLTHFQRAIAEVMPEIDEETISWRFHLVVGSMVHLLKFPNPINRLGSDKDFPQAIEHLIDFSIAALRHRREPQGV